MNEVFVLIYGVLLITELSLSVNTSVRTTAYGWCILAPAYMITAVVTSWLLGYTGLIILIAWCGWATCSTKAEHFRRDMAINYPKRYHTKVE